MQEHSGGCAVNRRPEAHNPEDKGVCTLSGSEAEGMQVSQVRDSALAHQWESEGKTQGLRADEDSGGEKGGAG